MAAAARSICSRYMLSGLQGFDFIIDERSGTTKLIEINARATQIPAILTLGPGRDLAAALFEALSGRRWRVGGPLSNPRTFLSFRANGVATHEVRT